MSDQVAGGAAVEFVEAKAHDMDGTPRFTKGDVLSLELPTEEFVVPTYDKAVLIQALNAKEQADYQASMYEVEADAKGKVTTRANMAGRNIKLVALGLREPALAEDEISKAPNDFVQPIADRIREISGMNVTVEDAEGN